ncbi:hypothetical protein U6G28_08905 [Actinomycetaceae bacterium MB13-C1-2]|nr:hypothetical protein U6G28_08905 [Actinomycetaceae bacterium MB13-C1-2]
MTTKRCEWCGKQRRKFSTWEQKTISTGKWEPLCDGCATRRLNNPWNALLGMRKIGETNAQ